MYAYYYPEGMGYLQVRDLGSGTQGDVALVRSIASGQLFARKKSTPATIIGNRPQSAEVRLYQTHPLIPRLIDWQDYHVQREAQGLVPVLRKVSSVTISQFCNGNSVRELYNAFRNKGQHVPEHLVWRCFSHLLKVIELLHLTCDPGIVHHDITIDNIWLHWPVNSKFPDFYVGDFGYANEIDPRARQQCAGISKDMMDVSDDLSGVYEALAYLMCGGSLDPRLPASCVSKGNMAKSKIYYSPELMQCYQELMDVAVAVVDDFNGYSLPGLRFKVDQALQTLDSQKPRGVAHMRPKVDARPQLFNSKAELLAAKPPPLSPWCVARVDPVTFQVSKVDREWQNGGVGNRYGVVANGSYTSLTTSNPRNIWLPPQGSR